MLVVIVSFALRAATFQFFVAPQTYYKQADSMDYHNSALCLSMGNGMVANGQPIFWRTPGYPAYLTPFYKYFGLTSAEFEANAPAQKASIWLQILISSFIPLVIFALAYLMTQLYFVANLAMWTAVVHVGLVLASAFLLTEGISLIFFYAFLFLLYKLILQEPKRLLLVALGAAATLSIYTWIRPMGECTGLWAAFLILVAGKGTWKHTTKKSLLFAIPFFLSLAPWYVRNYKLTDEFFFNPTGGPYLNCFSAPKIVRRVKGGKLEDICKELQVAAALEVRKKRIAQIGTNKFPSSLECKKISMPIILKYPHYFIYDWFIQNLKTTFDLYSYQLVAIANNSYYYDPVEEFLTEKVSDCLWAKPLPIISRIIAWLELLFMLALWFALFGGLWCFMLRPLWQKNSTRFILSMQRLWFITALIIAAPIGMTGGFGYARLRLPVEPLIIILALSFWYWFLMKGKSIEK
jgi:hypothetical protein